MATERYDQSNAVEGWGTHTQLVYGPPSPYRFRITGAEFNKDMKRTNKADILHLVLHGIPLDVDTLQPIENWATHSIEIACGPGWETPDNGQSAQHKDRSVYDGRSAAGELVDTIMTTGSLKQMFRDMAKRGKSTEAKAFEGLDITVGEGPRKKFRTDDGEVREYARPIPIDYHGYIDTEEISKQKAAADQELNNTLLKIAKDAETYDEFQSEAMALGVSDSNLLDDILNEGDDGFYARANETQEEEAK